MLAAVAAARELPQLSLGDALELTVLIARKRPAPRASTRTRTHGRTATHRLPRRVDLRRRQRDTFSVLTGRAVGRR